MSQRVPIEVADTRDGHLAVIEKYWDAFAFAAYEGYLEHRRGAVCLDLQNLETVSVYVEEALDRITYLPETSPEFQEKKMEPLLERVREYKPDVDIVVFVYGRDAGNLPTRVYGFSRQPSPREVFEKNSPSA